MGRGTRWTLALFAVGALALGWVRMSDDSPTGHSGGEVPANGEPGLAVESAAPSTEATGGSTEVTAEPSAMPSADRTEAGARTAAVAYLEMTEDAVGVAPAEAAAIQRSIATAGFADEFGADTEQRMVELRASIPGGIVLRIAPIEVRSSASGDDWLVSVWYAQAITIVGETVIDDWRTADYRLRWEDDAWRIADFSSDRGPMPGRGSQPPSASAIDFESQLSGYNDEGLG